MREERAIRVLPACSMAITFMVASLPLVSNSSRLQERLAWKTALGSGREGREGGEGGRGGREEGREEGRDRERGREKGEGWREERQRGKVEKEEEEGGRHKQGRMMMRIKEGQEEEE